MRSRENIYQKLEQIFMNHLTFSSVEELKDFFKSDINSAKKEMREKEKNTFIKRILDMVCKEQDFFDAEQYVHGYVELILDALEDVCKTKNEFPVSQKQLEVLHLKRNLTAIARILCEIEGQLEKLRQSYLMLHLPKLLSLYVNNGLSKDYIISFLGKTPTYEERMRLLGNVSQPLGGIQSVMDKEIPLPSTIYLTPFFRMANYRIQIEEDFERIVRSYSDELPEFISLLTFGDLDSDNPSHAGVISNMNLFLKAVKGAMNKKVKEGKAEASLPGQQLLF